MSLSQEPALSALKQYFVCGTKDITDEPYAGESGSHGNFGNALVTTNGAGPHNLQLFMLTPDGVVLNCLPGYWAPQDLVYEMAFAEQLNQVWNNKQYSTAQKNYMFRTMHLAHAKAHPKEMTNRSHLQGFDALYEAENHLATSDFIRDKTLITKNAEGHLKWTPNAFRTTDEVMHMRLASHPFERYDKFNVAAFSDYGKQHYDKSEDAMREDGHIDHEKTVGQPTLGKAHKPAEVNDDGKYWGNTFRK